MMFCPSGDMGPNERIDFLVGGVQKGGTTALFEHLRDHPALGLPIRKEIHFFDDEGQNWDAPDYTRYHACFAGLDDRERRGEATPIYLYWPNCLERIAFYSPDIRLILIFRDPVERAWSHWRMEKARGFDNASFSYAIRKGRARVASDATAPGYHRVFSYVERGFYASQLARAHALLGKESVLCLRSEDLQGRPEETIDRVCDFLMVPRLNSAVRARFANVGPQEDLGAKFTDEDRIYLNALYRDDLAAFAQISRLDLSAWAGGLHGVA